VRAAEISLAIVAIVAAWVVFAFLLVAAWVAACTVIRRRGL